VPRSALIAAAAAGLVLRLLFSLGYWVDKPLTRDEREYLAMARSEPLVDPFGRAPGYPAFLVSIGAAKTPVESVPASIKIAQSIVGAAGVLLVGMLAFQLAGPRAATLAAWIAAAYPPLVWTAAYALSEALYWPLALLAAWLLNRALAATRGSRLSTAAAAGVIVGATILVRPGFVVLLPLLAVWAVWRHQLLTVLLVFVTAALVMLPWTIRNSRHEGRFVLVASEGGVTFWTGNHPLARGEGDLNANPALKEAKAALRAAHPELTEQTMEPVYYREATNWILSNPLAWLRLEVKKLFYLIVPIGPSYSVHAWRYRLASSLSYALLLPLGAVGVLLAGRGRAATPALWLLLATAGIMCLVFFPQERFRLSMIDPILIVCAGALRADTRS
jgi:4-amino-4-deoxy-L-arabinose transferase-like glycosyltransferase